MVAIRTRSSREGAGVTRPLLMFGAFLVVLTLGGCRTAEAPTDAERVQAVVTRYDRLLAEGYRTMDMNRLRQVSEQLQGEDEYIHMSALAEGGVRLLPVLTEQEFTQVSVEATSAQVQTRETWDYMHEGRVTREITFVQRAMVYELVWDLVLTSDGRWVVSDVRALETTSSAPPERLSDPSAEVGLYR